MLRMLESQAPAKQTVTDTINILSSRLASATLLEDRRAAILGLRSFAKEYPASVASGSLRDLISSLAKDAADVDTTKVVLETLLMLFNPNERSPEASDDVSLWLADEFTIRQDNITILLDLLEAPDFYPRLYSLQLISAISSARLERTQECIYTAPLGIGRLTATLDDTRDAIRNEALLLLTTITQSHVELQKMVAFENAFERVFNLIQSDGGLNEGGIVVQDCLSLLANLVRSNLSNQSYFRETGCFAKLAALLPGGSQGRKFPGQEQDDWASPQKEKNLWGLLAILRMFLVAGSKGTPENQNAFQRHGLLQQVLDLAFSTATAIQIRAEALQTCADIIRGNARLQESFAQIQVTPPIDHHATANGQPHPNEVMKIYIIDALLDLALSTSSTQMFDVRLGAIDCIKAYCHNHIQIRHHFLHRAIKGHLSGEDATANALTILIAGPQAFQSTDPYRFWFASVLLFHLIYDDPEAKALLMDVIEGDAEAGEDVVTAIQAMASHLITSLQPSTAQDERVAIGYLMLLCGLLFDSAAATNDFLGEAITVNSLASFVSKSPASRVLTKGLCAALLGTTYEFSTADSPLPRRQLHAILTSEKDLGRDRYLDALTQLRQHPLIRDFEVLPQTAAAGSPAAGLPNIFFDAAFVAFLKDNFSRLARAIDRDPGLEIHLKSPEAVDRDILDSLRGALAEKDAALQTAEAEALDLQQRLEVQAADAWKTAEAAAAELGRLQAGAAAEIGRIGAINEALQRNHDAEMRERDQAHQARVQVVEAQLQRQSHALAVEMAQVRKEAADAGARVRAGYETQLASLRQEKEALHGQKSVAEERLRKVEELQAKEQMETEAEVHVTQISELGSRIEEYESRMQRYQDQRAAAEKEAGEKIEALRRELDEKEQEAKKRAEAMQKEVEEKEEERVRVQGELDDLLMVLGDLEDKRTKDKKRLKELGQETSDAEDDDGEEDEGGEEDEDDGEGGDGNESEDDKSR
ncbi:hypothetical protein W97_08654 [Coniosporium apollinis CBS 100218]|uniref:Vesicle tethering protein Uso1/P115-like head domain-containing protein n=1 Tax=Coniosporium apollinis (strain CBS 100218) TaxID=1168221 RepID=R7Z5U9_CONA1|nr:uncharacterized protein W97_08654 [Coniosporium apollinis CBS 100218]EON69394.1 hypothetical protein W97_08654 [Coniosporium apollinis CBS 100218]